MEETQMKKRMGRRGYEQVEQVDGGVLTGCDL
jgi:hypothetical protein